MKKVLIILAGVLLVPMLSDISLRGQICMGAIAFAQSEDEALILFQKGNEAFKIERFEDALVYFKKSLELNRALNNQLGVAVNLGFIGSVYEKLSIYDKSIKYLNEALMLYRQLKRDKDVPVLLKQIGFIYKSLNRHEESLNQFKEALALEKELNIPIGDIVKSLNTIGMIYDELGHYEEALKYYEDALKIGRELRIPHEIAESLNLVGKTYNSLGQNNEALRFHEEALKIRRELNIPEDIAVSLNNIAEVYSSTAQYDIALKYHEDALNIKRKYNLPQQSIAVGLNNIGKIYTLGGQYIEALNYYGEALKILKKSNDNRKLAGTLNNVGQVYFKLGQYEKALKNFHEALVINKKTNTPVNIATTLNDIGLVYYSLGRYDEALRYHDESLKITRQLNIPQDIAQSLNNIGLVYDSLGRYAEAIKYHDESFEIVRGLNIPQDIANSLSNMGYVYLSLKDYKKAEELFKKAEKEFAKQVTGFKWRGNPGLVDVYIATQRHNEALNLLTEMTPRWFTGIELQIQYHTQHGLALKSYKNLKEASSEFLKAVTLTEEMRHKLKGEKGGFFGGGTYGGRIRTYRGLFSTLAERAIDCKMQDKECMDKEFNPYGQDLSSAAFYFAESTKARTLLEAMAESGRKSQRVEIPEDLREKEQSILNQLSAIENQWEDAYKRGEDILKRLKEKKDGLNVELNNLITELRQKYPRYVALNYPKPIPPEELPLKEDEVLLEYAIGDDAGYLFVVRKGGVKRLIKIPLSKGALEEKVKAFIEPMNTKQYERFSVKDANGLYEILLAEAVKEIKENEKFIIVPDGILGLLPFEALVIKEGKDYKNSLYVRDRYQISYYQSATVLSLQRNLKERKTDRLLFALGNPIYTKEDPRYLAWKENKKATMVAGLDRYSFRGIAIKAKWGKTTEADTTGKDIEFPPLPETEIEIKEIAKMMNVRPEPPDILLSVMANETELRKTGLERYKYIHFATHASLPGMIQGLNEPFILLGQVENKDKDDGFLTLSEVLDLRLNADMVVLSACVTGVGKEVEGEGVANFARAFQHAGVQSVIVSLWEVASDPAVEYMEKFYGYLKAGKGRGEAMRLARNEIKAKYPNPFYWAVFILHGEG